MNNRIKIATAFGATAIIIAMVVVGCAQQPVQSDGASSSALPRYQVDPLWMKSMPDN